MSEVLGTFYERGRHAVIYGDRGVGKTSLANVTQRQLARREDVRDVARPLVLKAGCDSTGDFTSVWRRVLRGVAGLGL